MIEIQALNNTDHKLNIFLSHEKIPTYRNYDFHSDVKSLPYNDTLEDFKFHYWFLNNNQLLNRTGRWFMSVLELKENMTENELEDRHFDKSKIANLTTDYNLRTYTAGCYYLDEKYEEWTG